MSFFTCVVFAGTPAQKRAFEALVGARKERGLYPREVSFIVLSDPETGRIGSGGATVAAAVATRGELLEGKGILVINAGGESRRMPAYAPEGKLFSPVPVSSSSLFPSVLLDLQLTLFLSYPWSSGELVVTSGDVFIDFDTDAIPLTRGDIHCFAAADSFEKGSRHGVFALDRDGSRVLDYRQKEPAEFLARNARLEGSDTCALDTGIVSFSAQGAAALLRLAQRPLENGASFGSRLDDGSITFDLYLELLTSCLAGLSEDGFVARVQPRSTLPQPALRALHAAMRGVDLRATVTRRTTFLHFGALAELPGSALELSEKGVRPFYEYDDPEISPARQGKALLFNCTGTSCGTEASADPVLLEGCVSSSIRSAGGRNVFRGLRDLSVAFPVPQGFCLDERDLPSGTYLLVYSVLDSWLPVPGMEQARFCGAPLPEWLTKRRLTAQDILESRAPGSTEGRRFDLHEARLFVAGAGVDFVEGYIHPPADPAAWAAEFRAGTRLSLREINDEDSVEQREARRRHVRAQLLRNTILSGRGWTSVCERDFRDTFRRQDVDALRKLSESSGDSLRRFYRMRNLRSLLRGGPDADSVEELHIDYRGRTDSPALFRRAVRQEQTVRASAPVRMDLAGGWTDTPPYTLREGGEVVNVAVDLDGRPPIQVTCRSTAEKLIVLRSVDTDAREIVRGFRQLEDYRSLQSPFSLPKAALCLLGMTREGTRSGSLAEALDRIGCGIELSMLSGVPQGSGLGTSSILGATVIAALERFSGIALDIQEVSRKVLRMEQMLTTGGGWQDQLGGICGGVKYLSSAPGIAPNPIIHQLDPFILEDEGHARRLTLYYTGITRLAKNILQEVVERVAGAEPAYLFTLRSLKVLARRARDSFALRDLNRLAGVVQESWEANKRIHLSTTNDEVDALLAATQGLSAGMKLLGAGGGGFALFISRTPRDASALREALAARSGTAARLTRMSLNKDGLRVEVS